MKQQKSLKNKVHLTIEPKDELISLNHDLYDEFTIYELEERLETKPWLCGVHVDCPSLDCGVNNPPTSV